MNALLDLCYSRTNPNIEANVTWTVMAILMQKKYSLLARRLVSVKTMTIFELASRKLVPAPPARLMPRSLSRYVVRAFHFDGFI
jgi:hypothetical protein